MREVPPRKPPAADTAIDRLVEYFAPGLALKRRKARVALALTSGYAGASRTRPALSGFRPYAADADSDTIPDLPTLRARSRSLYRDSPIAGGAVSTVVTHSVGRGLWAQPAIDHEALGMSEEQADAWEMRAAREWLLWSESADCDITRTQHFRGLQELAMLSTLLSGDVFALTPKADRGGPYRLALQLIEADRCSNPQGKRDTPQLTAGVELDGGGAPVAYHFSRQHPGSLLHGRTAMEWDRVAAFGAQSGRRNVLHLFERLRPGQTRGVPMLAPVIEPLKQITRYTEAELQAAVVSGAFAVFVKMDPEAFETLFGGESSEQYLDAARQWDGTLPAEMDGPGKAVNLLPGEGVETVNPGRPNAQFDPFMLAIIRQIGLRLEIPYEVLVKHFTASYSAAQAALLDAWRFFRKRRAWLEAMFCQPVYELWLAEAVARGRIAAPGFFADPLVRRAWSGCMWTGDGPGAIDPVKEATGAEKRIELEISTRNDESIRFDGIPWHVKHRQRVKEERMRKADGTAPVQTPARPGAPEEGAPPGSDRERGDLETL